MSIVKSVETQIIYSGCYSPANWEITKGIAYIHFDENSVPSSKYDQFNFLVNGDQSNLEYAVPDYPLVGINIPKNALEGSVKNPKNFSLVLSVQVPGQVKPDVTQWPFNPMEIKKETCIAYINEENPYNYLKSSQSKLSIKTSVFMILFAFLVIH